MAVIQTLTLDLLPSPGSALSTWNGFTAAVLSPLPALELTVGGILLSSPWTRSIVRSTAGSVMTIASLLAVLQSSVLSPFLLFMCLPPSLYGVAQGAFWASSRGKRIVWFLPVMDGRARHDLLRGACWFWAGVCVVGLGFHFAYTMNPQGLRLDLLEYGIVQLGFLAAWVAALMVGYTLAVYSLSALFNGFLGMARTVRHPRLELLLN